MASVKQSMAKPHIKKRDLVFVAIISILTFGIYTAYWFVKTKDEINSLGADIPTAWLMIIPLANFYWLYRYLEGFSKFVKKDNNEILWFLFFMVIPPVPILVIQSELNKLA